MRTGGLARLDQFLSVLTRREAILLDTKRLTWCLLNLVAFFSIKQRDNVGWCARMQRHKVDVAKDLFHSAMDMVLPEKQTEVIKYSVTYFRLTLQWYLEDFVAFVFNVSPRCSSYREIEKLGIRNKYIVKENFSFLHFFVVDQVTCCCCL